MRYIHRELTVDTHCILSLIHIYQSAAGGNTYAENNIGFMYTYGLGVTKDYSQAFKWLNRAATQGNPEAQIGMGSLYKNEMCIRDSSTYSREKSKAIP